MTAARQYFHVPAGETRGSVLERISRTLSRLPPDKPFRVEVQEHRPKRTDAQNALLWSLYEEILRKGGETLGGWTKEDLHEFFLGEHFGWVVHEGFGQRRKKPARRSSGLNKQEMTDFIDYIVRFMAERGVVLELPGDPERAA